MEPLFFTALAGSPVADTDRVSPYWLMSSYLILTVAELFLSPMGLSFVSKVAPSRFQGLMQGGWLLRGLHLDVIVARAAGIDARHDGFQTIASGAVSELVAAQPVAAIHRDRLPTGGERGRNDGIGMTVHDLRRAFVGDTWWGLAAVLCASAVALGTRPKRAAHPITSTITMARIAASAATSTAPAPTSLAALAIGCRRCVSRSTAISATVLIISALKTKPTVSPMMAHSLAEM